MLSIYVGESRLDWAHAGSFYYVTGSYVLAQLELVPAWFPTNLMRTMNHW